MRFHSKIFAFSLWLAVTAAIGSPKELMAQEQKGAIGTTSESDFRVNVQAIKEFFLQLPVPLPPEFPERRIKVRVPDVGDKKLLLPIYVIKDVKILDDAVAGPQVSVAILDALNHPDMEDSIHNAMDKQIGKDKWIPVMPIDNSVGLSLWINSNGEEVPLAVGHFSRATGQYVIKMSFNIDAPARPMLKVADLSELGLSFSETYRGRFQKDNLNATLNVASDYALTFKNLLSSDPTGQKATLLVTIGGGVDQTLAVQNYFSRRVAIEVRRREGSQVNPSLINHLIDKLFTDLYNKNVDLSKQGNAEVVTFLFANGLKATSTMGTFKTIVDKLKKEADQLKETANSLSTKDQTKNEVDVSGNFSFLGIGGGGANTVKWEKLKEQSSSESLKLQSHDFTDMAKAIEGELPVAVMNAAQLQTLNGRANDVTTIDIGTFTNGQAALTFPLSFQAYTKWLEDRRLAESHELAEKQSSEAARDAARTRIAAARTEQAKLMGKAAGLVTTLKNSCVEARELRKTEFYIAGLRDGWRHLSAIGRWGKGEGDKFFAEWAAARDNPSGPTTRGEKFSTVVARRPALDAVFDSASKDIVDVLGSLAKQEAIIGEAEKEIRKQQEKIDKITKDIGGSIKN